MYKQFSRKANALRLKKTEKLELFQIDKRTDIIQTVYFGLAFKYIGMMATNLPDVLRLECSLNHEYFGSLAK